MSNLKLGSNGDLVIGRGAERTSGLQYTGQLITTRLKTLYGEWQLNRTIGLPWYTDLLRHNYNPNLIYNWISKTILATSNVTGLKELEIGVVKSERTLLVHFVASTIYGDVTSDIEI